MRKEKAFEEQRKKLIEEMKATGAIASREVEQAFLAVKRELFVPKEMLSQSYDDTAMPIGFGQTISQPSTIAVMLEMLEPKKGQVMGEVGCGCGYVLALLSQVAGPKGKVIGVEMIKELAQIAKKNLEKQECTNVEVIEGDGVKIICGKEKFDRILISAACPFIPKELFDCLKEHGRIVAPTGDEFTQTMTVLEKNDSKPFKKEYSKGQFVFVPLKGKHGFRQL